MPLPDPNPLGALHDRLSLKIEKGRKIQLSPDDLDWFVVSGAYATFLEFVGRQAFDASKKRLEAQGFAIDAAGPKVPEA